MKRFFSAVYRLDLSFHVIAGVVLAFMMVVTLLDVVMRAFGRPIIGSIEIICFSGAVVASFAIPYSSWKKAHIYVDIFENRLSEKSWTLLQTGTRIAGIILFGFMGVSFILYGLTLLKSGEVSAGFKIPYYPITFGLALSCFLESLTLACDLLKRLQGSGHE